MKSVIFSFVLLLVSLVLLWAAVEYSAFAEILDCGFNSGDQGISEAFASWGLAVIASIAIYCVVCPFFFKKKLYWLAPVVFVPIVWFAIMSVFLSPGFVAMYVAHARSKLCEIGLPSAIGTDCIDHCSEMESG